MLSYYLDKKFEVKKCCNEVQSEKDHFHKELSIGLIEKGNTTVKFEDQFYNFNKKDLIIIPPKISS